MRLRAACVLACLSLGPGLSAAAFEGSIRYALTTPQGDTGALVLTSSGQKVRADVDLGGGSNTSIIDLQAKTVTVLMPNRKAYTVNSLPPTPKGSAAAAQGTVTQGAYSSVAGYGVRDYLYSLGSKRTSFWITDQLGQGPGAGLAGGLGQVQVPGALAGQGGVLLKISDSTGFEMAATKVSPGPVDPSRFKVPAGYTKLAGASLGNGQGTEAGAAAPSDLNNAMQNMTPEQKALLQQMMRQQGSGQ